MVWNWGAPLTKDFRYQLRFGPTDTGSSVDVEIEVRWPGRARHWLENGEIETCEESGCRDGTLSRSPYECRPSPSPSRSSAFDQSSPVPPSANFDRSRIISGTDSFHFSHQRPPTRPLIDTLRLSDSYPIVDSIELNISRSDAPTVVKSLLVDVIPAFDETASANVSVDDSKPTGLSAGVIAGIASVGFLSLCIIPAVLVLKRRCERNKESNGELEKGVIDFDFDQAPNQESALNLEN
jgi:hypothetical protein